MPLHFQSITNDDQNPSLLAALLSDFTENYDSVFVSRDKYIHIQKHLNNTLTGQEFGKAVYTAKIDDEKGSIVLLDLDIMLKGKGRSALCLNERLSGSSDANEYYEAEISGDDGHLKLETVNRHTIEGALINRAQDVSACAFPFELNVFADIDALNHYLGFSKDAELGDSGIKVGGLSERFIMPGGIFDGEADDDHYSFLVGTIRSFSDVRWELEAGRLDFIIANIDTALGEIPVAMSREVFDLSELAVGAVICMRAYIKADVSKPEAFTATAQRAHEERP